MLLLRGQAGLIQVMAEIVEDRVDRVFGFVVEEQDCLLHEAFVPRMKLDGRDKLVFWDVDRDDEVMQQAPPAARASDR